MPDWVNGIGLIFDWQTVIALVSLIVSLGALYQSSKSSKAAERSAKAAEDANEHSKKMAEAAEINARAAQQDELKRCKINAHWSLQHIHGQFPHISEKWDISAIRDLLGVYGEALPSSTREKVKLALNGLVELMSKAAYLTHDDAALMQKIWNDVEEAVKVLEHDLHGPTGRSSSR